MSALRHTRRRTYLRDENKNIVNVKKDPTRVTKRIALRDRTNIPRPLKESNVPRKENVFPSTTFHETKADVEEKQTVQCIQGVQYESMDVDIIPSVDSLELDSGDDVASEDDECDRVIFVSNYVRKIYKYLRCFEEHFILDEHFLDHHKDLTPRMRYVLVDWLSKVHSKFDLSLDCFHLTILILDRFIALCKSIGKHNLQLIGTTSLLIASKIEEVYPPAISDLAFMTENAVSCEEIRSAEVDILGTLNFELNIPLPLHFYRRLSHLCRFTTKQHYMGKYLLELCLMEAELCHYRPSKLAAAAVWLVRLMMCDGSLPWTRTLQVKCKYSESEIRPVAIILSRNLLRHTQPSKYRAIRDKYASSSNYHVSVLPCISCDSVVRIAHST